MQAGSAATRGRLIAVLGDEDTCVGFLLGGVGELNRARAPNYLVVTKATPLADIEEAFKGFVERDDIAVILINQVTIANFFFAEIWARLRGRWVCGWCGRAALCLTSTRCFPATSADPLAPRPISNFLTFIYLCSHLLPPPPLAAHRGDDPLRHRRAPEDDPGDSGDPLQGAPLRPLQGLHPAQGQGHVLRRGLPIDPPSTYDDPMIPIRSNHLHLSPVA